MPQIKTPAQIELKKGVIRTGFILNFRARNCKYDGVRAVGIEIDPKLILEAEENARQANVSSLVTFRNDDMFRTSLREASVVTLYLSEKLNVLLRPKLLRELRPGARIVSHDFRMGDWEPEQTVRVPWGKLYRTVYLWTVPDQRKSSVRRN